MAPVGSHLLAAFLPLVLLAGGSWMGVEFGVTH